VAPELLPPVLAEAVAPELPEVVALETLLLEAPLVLLVLPLPPVAVEPPPPQPASAHATATANESFFKFAPQRQRKFPRS